jgi:hypothetical protein
MDVLAAAGRSCAVTLDIHTVDALSVPIPDQVPWRLVPGERLCNLTRDPFGRWVGRHIHPDKLSPSQPNNDQGIEQVKSNRRHHKQVHGGDLRCNPAIVSMRIQRDGFFMSLAPVLSLRSARNLLPRRDAGELIASSHFETGSCLPRSARSSTGRRRAVVCG